MVMESSKQSLKGGIVRWSPSTSLMKIVCYLKKRRRRKKKAEMEEKIDCQ